MALWLVAAALLAPTAALRIGGESLNKDPLRDMDLAKQRIEAGAKQFFQKLQGKHEAFPAEGAKFHAEGASNHMCESGHIMPSVFLLGFQKAGTSTLFKDLRRQFPDLEPATPLEGQEEEWQSKEVDFFSDPNRYKKGKQFYLKHFPKCTERVREFRTLDSTINNLWGGKDTAMKVKTTYGDKAKDIKFLIIARDPAQRMSSAYHHFEADGIGKPWRKFDDYVKRTINEAHAWMERNMTGKEPEPNLYKMSLYADVLEPWTEVFEPSQFTVITLRQYQQRNKETLKLIENRLDTKRQGCRDDNNQPCNDILQANFRYHAPLKKETKQKLDEFFEKWGANKKFENMIRTNHMGLEDSVEEKRFAEGKGMWDDEQVAPKNARLIDEEYKNNFGKWEGRKYNTNNLVR
jgi:hypothetical protein